MKKNYENVLQFKITLKHIKPPIWRRIQVPETYSFWDLHTAIQDAMGWYDEHLHEFVNTNCYKDKRSSILIGLSEGNKYIRNEKNKIAPYFSEPKAKMLYQYDFGDGWEHDILLEKILPRENGVDYPICLTGKRACPPEDCGGVYGYYQILGALSGAKELNIDDEDDEDLLEWLGDDYDPEDFDPEKVIFDDPAKRWKHAKSFMS